MRTALLAAFISVLVLSVLAQDPPQRIRISGGVAAAQAISRPQPIYPPLAKQARIQGVVRLEALIGKDGSVQNLKVISGHPLLAPAAVDAVRQWRYKPTILNGQPVEVITTIDVNFTLADPDQTLLTEGAGLTREQAAAWESSLAPGPEERNARIRLLGYYAAAMRSGSADPAQAAYGRRQQVLWLIEHHPDAGVLLYPEAQLVPGRHRLADAEGYQEAKRLWLDLATRSTDTRIVVNAVRFLEICDRQEAERVLLQAQSAQPSPMWASMLGRVYALAVLGLSAESLDGPAVFDPREAQTAFAQRARAALWTGSDGNVLAAALRTLAQVGKSQVEADAQLTALAQHIQQQLESLPRPKGAPVKN